MIFTFSVSYFPFIVAMALSAFIIISIWKFRNQTIIKTILYLVSACFLWSAANMLEYGFNSLEVKIFFVNIEYMSIVTIPVAWVMLAALYTERKSLIRIRYVMLLMIIPVVTLILIWTNSYHHLMRYDITLDTSGPYSIISKSYGPWFWVATLYNNLLMLAGTLMFIDRIFKPPKMHHIQIVLLLACIFFPWGGNFLYIFKVFPELRMDLTSVLLSLSMLIFTFGLLRHHLLEAIPVAREHLIENLTDGIVVIDNLNRIIDYNQASVRIFNIDEHYFARPADCILNTLQIPTESLTVMSPVTFELEYHDGVKTIYYNLKVELLYDSYNQYRGRLFHVQDISALKEKENIIRKLLQEKEFLLKEVHHRIKNNMGSVMGLLKLQASRAKSQDIKNEILAARDRIQINLILYDRLYRSENFSALSVKEYIHSLTDNIMEAYDFNRDITVDLDVVDYTLPPKILFPLGIILNEILTNAIKYAFGGIEEKKISIKMTVLDKHIILLIKDNGIGIPETVKPKTSPGFGLQLVDMMIHQVNGTLKIIRDRGTGYQFEINIG